MRDGIINKGRIKTNQNKGPLKNWQIPKQNSIIYSINITKIITPIHKYQSKE